MLDLSRKKEEAIVIGDNIRVTVLEVRGNRVRLRIQAPDDVAVHRLEIHCQIDEFCSIDEPIGTERKPAAAGRSSQLTGNQSGRCLWKLRSIELMVGLRGL